MRVIKEIGNGIIAFLLCLALMAGFVIFLISHTVLKEEYILKQLEKNDFYERMETDLKNGFEEYQYQSGFSSEVFQDLFTKEMVKQDVNSVVAYLYEGTQITSQKAFVQERIRQNMNQFISENQIALTQKQQENMDDFEKIIVNVYESKINVVPKYLEQIASLRQKASKLIMVAQKVCVGVLLTILILALGMNLKTMTSFLRTMGITLLSSGILLMLLRLLIVQNIEIKNILLFSQLFSDLIKEVMYDMLFTINQFGVWGIIVGFLIIVIANYQKIKNGRGN